MTTEIELEALCQNRYTHSSRRLSACNMQLSNAPCIMEWYYN